MQLNRPPLRHALALASCALIHGTAHAADGDWRLAGEVLSYDEKDRVSVMATSLSATRDLGDESSVTVRGVYDSLSGASPNGAAPATSAQTFTGPSGKNSYTTPAYKLPLQKFSDHRYAAGVDYTTRTSPTSGRTLSADVSQETDYFSVGGSSTWTHDFNNKLTTLALGIGGSYDLVQPNAGFPTGLTSLSAASTTTCASGSGGEDSEGAASGCGENSGKQKVTLNALIGVTQVVSRRTLVQLNDTIAYQTGYLTDPYKIISIVDPASGATVDYKFEKRPSQRVANAVYTKLVHNFDHDVVHLSYRYFVDDWGVRAHTIEAQYRFMMGEHLYLEPQYHYHLQSAANFFRNSLTTTDNPSYASADLRLGDMTATMAGLKLGVKIGAGELSFRYATMTEVGDSHPSGAIGVQKQVDLYPKLDANIWNIGFVMPL